MRPVGRGHFIFWIFFVMWVVVGCYTVVVVVCNTVVFFGFFVLYVGVIFWFDYMVGILYFVCIRV